jgi:hypothetical protein
MKYLMLVATCVAALGCGSNANKVKLIEPEVELYQLVGPADLNYPRGQIEVQLGLRVANRSELPIKLRRVAISPVGGGGPYRVRTQSYFFNREIPPGRYEDIAFWARANATGDAFSIDANAPITLRAIAYFDSPAGATRKVLLKTFTQFGTGARKGD